MASRPTRVLIVEDDQKLASLVREFLETNGFEAATEARGDRAPARILDEQPDLVILDLMLPGLDGLSVCKEVRPGYQGAILMLTARGDEVDEVVGLEIGADDYMAKPVRPRLLLARIHSLLRRVGRTPDDRGGGQGARDQRVEVGALLVDAASRSVQLDDRVVELTTAEFDLLWLLARNVGEVVSRERIYAELRGIEYDGLDRSIDLRITRLRKKLGDDGRQPRWIKSVRGAGYLLVREP
jgi:two-component system response regulator RstA